MIIFAGIVARFPEDALKIYLSGSTRAYEWLFTVDLSCFLLLLLPVLCFLKRVNEKFLYNIRVVL